MIETDTIREALKRYRRVTVTELASVMAVTPKQLRNALARDDVTSFVQATGDSFMGSPVIAYRAPGSKPIKPALADLPEDPFDALRIDPGDPFAGLDPKAAIRVENIMHALAQLSPTFDETGIRTHNRHLPYAQALPHIKPRTRHRVPMSEHQRYMDRLGGGIWATVVRADMRRVGLMPRYR